MEDKSKGKAEELPFAEDSDAAGIGARAGGLEAFTQLLENLPADTGMACVLVQHLAAAQKSMLTELLSKVTPVPVREVKDEMTGEEHRDDCLKKNWNPEVACHAEQEGA